MNTKLALISLAALGGLAFANSASARPDIRVNIGFGAPAPIVRYAPAPVAYCAPAPVVIANPYRPAGYWKEIVVKTWVPSTYVMSRDWRGRPVRMIEPGHFAFRTERVWENNCG